MKMIFIAFIFILEINLSLNADVNLIQTTYSSAIALNNNNILTLSSKGILRTTSAGTRIDLIAFPQAVTLKEFELAKFFDGSIVAYNGNEVLYFTNEGVFIKQLSYLGPDPNPWSMSPILIVSESTFLLVNLMPNGIKPAILDKDDDANVLTKSVSLTRSSNVYCTYQALGSGFNCAYENIIKICVAIITHTLTKENDYCSSASSPIAIRITQLNRVEFILFYRRNNYEMSYQIFDESTKTFSSEVKLPITTTDSIKKINVLMLNTAEFWLLYGELNKNVVERINKSGFVIGTKTQFPTGETGSVLQQFPITFANGDNSLLYSVVTNSFLLELNLPSCFDFCIKEKVNTDIIIDLSKYSSTNNIEFTTLPSECRLQQGGTDLSSNTPYPTSTQFICSGVAASNKIIAIFDSINNSHKAECTITLNIDNSDACFCNRPYYSYEGNCVTTCPQYTAIDPAKLTCTNCKTNGEYNYNGQCVATKPSNTFITNDSYNVIEDCDPSCATCLNAATQCMTCNPATPNCITTCPSGYIKSADGTKCVQCYDSCEKCNDKGNPTDNKCVTCKVGYEFYPVSSNECVDSCNNAATSRWLINDFTSERECFAITSCPHPQQYYVPDTNQCVISCSKTDDCIKCQSTATGMFLYNNECKVSCPRGTIENPTTNVCDPDLSAPGDFNDELNDLESDLVNNVNSIIRGDNYTIEIYNSTTSGGQYDLSKIDFSKCEILLRQENGLAFNEILIFVKVDFNRTNAICNQVEYQVYDSKGEQLSLSVCGNTTINVKYHIKNDTGFDIDTAKEFKKIGVDIYDPGDDFFNDICFPFATEKGTDIILRDRIKDIYRNITLCEDGCDYTKVDLDDLTVNCECKIKQEISTTLKPNIFVDGLTSAFTESNFKVVLCYNLAFDLSIITHNAGFWFYLVLMIIHLPNWLYYCIVGITPIQNKLSEFPKASPNKPKDYIGNIITQSDTGNNDDVKLKEFVVKTKETRSVASGSLNGIAINLNHGEIRRSLFMSNPNPNPNPNQISSTSLYSMIKCNDIIVPHPSAIEEDATPCSKNKSNAFSNKKIGLSSNQLTKINAKTRNNYMVDINSTEKEMHSEKTSEQITLKFLSSKIVRKKSTTTTMNTDIIRTTGNQDNIITEQANEKKEPSREFLDDFDINEAKLFDSRSIWLLFYISLKAKHCILSTFVRDCRLDLRCIVIIVFLINNVLDFAFNAFFYTDDLISNRYNYEGSAGVWFTIQNNIVVSLVSFIVSSILLYILSFLASSQTKFERIMSLRNHSQKEEALMKKAIKCFKIKLLLFLILEMIIMIFCWYYVMAFCAVYQTSQMSWLTGGLTSFAINLLIPFPFALMILFLRQIAIKYNKNWLFKFSLWWYNF